MDIVDINLNKENSSQENSSQLFKVKEKESKLSFSQLFKYAGISDKLMIFFGIIFSIILGFCLPTM